MKEAWTERTKPCVILPSPLRLGKRARRRTPRGTEMTHKYKKKKLPEDRAAYKRQYPQEEAKVQDGIAYYNTGNKYCHTIAI